MNKKKLKDVIGLIDQEKETSFTSQCLLYPFDTLTFVTNDEKCGVLFKSEGRKLAFHSMNKEDAKKLIVFLQEWVGQ